MEASRIATSRPCHGRNGPVTNTADTVEKRLNDRQRYNSGRETESVSHIILRTWIFLMKASRSIPLSQSVTYSYWFCVTSIVLNISLTLGIAVTIFYFSIIHYLQNISPSFHKITLIAWIIRSLEILEYRRIRRLCGNPSMEEVITIISNPSITPRFSAGSTIDFFE